MQCSPAAPQRPPPPGDSDLGLERFPAHAVVARVPDRLYLQLACLPSRRASIPVLAGRGKRQFDPFRAVIGHRHHPGLLPYLQDPARFIADGAEIDPIEFGLLPDCAPPIVVADLQLAAGGAQLCLVVLDPELEAAV
jgi:hypothetical protein